MTAHHGWNEFSQAKQGETVFVTAASGMHVLRVPTRLAGRSDRIFRSSRGVRTLCSVILCDIITLTPLRRTVVQLAKAAGLKVIASAGSDEKVDFVSSIGADVAFNYKTESTSEVLKREGPINM